MSGVSADILRDLNPVLVKGVTPPGQTYDLRVPDGSRSTITAALVTSPGGAATVVSTNAAPHNTETHLVRPRETLSAIARRYGVSVRDVVKWNSLDTNNRIKPGDRLRVADARGENDGRVIR